MKEFLLVSMVTLALLVTVKTRSMIGSSPEIIATEPVGVCLSCTETSTAYSDSHSTLFTNSSLLTRSGQQQFTCRAWSSTGGVHRPFVLNLI